MWESIALVPMRSIDHVCKTSMAGLKCELCLDSLATVADGGVDAAICWLQLHIHVLSL